ncbi:MAG: thiamine-phosphate kinase [Sphingobacteriaceae bacterium]|nr:thiamine-phosphate kinase [Cytophagaceae bacterium]
MESRTELAQLGEFGLIRRIAMNAPPAAHGTVRGIGDDAAVLDTPGDTYTLLSTELLIEGIHFDLAYVPLRHLGYKTVAVGVSDILAMNGSPEHLTLSLGLSNRFSLEALDEFYAGVRTACEQYGLDLVGGDTTTARAGLTLGVTVTGSVDKTRVTYRSGAQPNDILCLSGDVGAAYFGLQLLEREKQVFLANPDMQPQLADFAYIVQRQLRPEARPDVVRQLRELNIVPTAMIDVSDGLAAELLHLSAESKVGVTIFEEQLPIHDKTFLAATELNFSPITAALNGGEDYELLFSIRQQDYQVLLDHTTDISFIGFVNAEAGRAELITKAGEVVPITAPGRG